MLRRSTSIIFGLFLFLLILTIFWQRTRGFEKPEEPTAVAGAEKYVIDVQQAQIVGVKLQNAESKTVEMARGADGKWVLTNPKAEATDDTAAINAITQLLALTVESTPSQATSLEAVGLDAPAYRIQLNMEDGSQFLINVGKSTPTGNGYYILTNDRVIYIVSKFSLESFLKLLEAPPVLVTPTPEVTPTLEVTPTPEAAGGMPMSTVTP